MVLLTSLQAPKERVLLGESIRSFDTQVLPAGWFLNCCAPKIVSVPSGSLGTVPSLKNEWVRKKIVSVPELFLPKND